MSNLSYMTFRFAGLTQRARVTINDQTFTIESNGVGLSSSSGTVSLASLSISSTTLEIVPAGTIPDVSVRIYVSNGDRPVPTYVGGSLVLPDKATFTVAVDNGGTAQFTSDNDDWSVKTTS